MQIIPRLQQPVDLQAAVGDRITLLLFQISMRVWVI